MVRIRLRRTGKKGQPSYRVVVADSESPRDGRFIENIGHYNPRTDPPTISIDADRAIYWLSQGAQPSDSAATLLRKEGVLARFEAIKQGAPDPGPSAKETVAAVVDADLEAAVEAETEADAADADAADADKVDEEDEDESAA
jgi:small subunit ribosomal protein S16